MSALRKRRVAMVAAGVFLLYLIPYLVTTTVKPQGTGGLTGPLKVRVFRSEKHLMAFYPLYLMERWARNFSFTFAAYHFNVDFQDGKYERPWLYGDGKYSRIWYDFW
jgi:hypothetical protein